MRSITEGEKMYIPALILLETNSGGFSTNLSIAPVFESKTTTPYLLGSSTLVTFQRNVTFKGNKEAKRILFEITTIVPSFPCFL